MSLLKRLLRPFAKLIWHGVKHILEFYGWDYSRIFQIRRGVHLIVFQTDLIPQTQQPIIPTAVGKSKEMWPLSDFNTTMHIYKDL